MVRQVWKVGELAAATGLTVRTLHHWHHTGVVAPSARTTAGHRLYDESDVRRVYQVVALRALGLPLDAVAEVLRGGTAGFGDVLDAHLAQVRGQIVALRRLEATLTALTDGVRRTGPPSTTDLLSLIDEVSTMTETFRNYFTDEQLAALQVRREQIGDAHIAAVQEQWPPLVAAMQAELDAGTDPAEPRVQELARRWMALLDEFDGGDPALRASMNRMRAENAAVVEQHGGPSSELIEYVKLANQA